MTATRRRAKQVKSFKDRLVDWAKGLIAQADMLPPGGERDALLARASQADTAAQIDDWANSSGLQPPK
jgi:hypothetical protein